MMKYAAVEWYVAVKPRDISRNIGCLETGDVVSSNLCPNLNFRAPGFGNWISFKMFGHQFEKAQFDILSVWVEFYGYRYLWKNPEYLRISTNLDILGYQQISMDIYGNSVWDFREVRRGQGFGAHQLLDLWEPWR